MIAPTLVVGSNTPPGRRQVRSTSRGQSDVFTVCGFASVRDGSGKHQTAAAQTASLVECGVTGQWRLGRYDDEAVAGIGVANHALHAHLLE